MKISLPLPNRIHMHSQTSFFLISSCIGHTPAYHYLVVTMLTRTIGFLFCLRAFVKQNNQKPLQAVCNNRRPETDNDPGITATHVLWFETKSTMFSSKLAILLPPDDATLSLLLHAFPFKSDHKSRPVLVIHQKCLGLADNLPISVRLF